MPDIIRRCKRIKGYVPDRALWGKYRLSSHFPYLLKANFCHIEAKDATRVKADKEDYLYPTATGLDSRIESNKLLYAMANGKKFSNGMTANEVRAAWAEGKVPGDNIADIAAKAENSYWSLLSSFCKTYLERKSNEISLLCPNTL